MMDVFFPRFFSLLQTSRGRRSVVGLGVFYSCDVVPSDPWRQGRGGKSWLWDVCRMRNIVQRRRRRLLLGPAKHKRRGGRGNAQEEEAEVDSEAAEAKTMLLESSLHAASPRFLRSDFRWEAYGKKSGGEEGEAKNAF